MSPDEDINGNQYPGDDGAVDLHLDRRRDKVYAETDGNGPTEKGWKIFHAVNDN